MTAAPALTRDEFLAERRKGIDAEQDRKVASLSPRAIEQVVR